MIQKQFFITFTLLSLIVSSTDPCNSIKPESEDNCLYAIFNSDFANNECCYVTYNTTSGDTIKECQSIGKDESEQILKQSVLGSNRPGINETTLNVMCPKVGPIKNNCGVVGLGEPFKKEHCSVITIPERYCCLLTYKIAGDPDIHHACRLVDDYINEGKTTKEARELITLLDSQAVLEKGICSHNFIKHTLSCLIVSLVLFIL